jgi:hypothetical protein
MLLCGSVTPVLGSRIGQHMASGADKGREAKPSPEA